MAKTINADALMAAWPRATDEQKAAAMAALTGATIPANGCGMFPRVISAAETARLCNLSPRSLRSYARRGLLRPAYFGGSQKRSWGYSAASVRDFLQRACGE